MWIKVILCSGGLFSLLLLNGCTSVRRTISNFVFPPNPNSDRRVGEKVSLDLLYGVRDRAEIKKQCPSTQEKESETRGLFFAAAPALAGFALDEINKFLAEEAERYSATYSATAVGDTFYGCIGEEAPINLRAVKLSRTVRQAPHRNEQMAMEFCMLVEPTLDRTAFQLFPIHLKVAKSKAKLIAVDWLSPINFDLLAPWTILKMDGWPYTENKPFGYDNDVDFNIEVLLDAIWIDDEQTGHYQSIAKQAFSFPNVELGADLPGFLTFSNGMRPTCSQVNEGFAQGLYENIEVKDIKEKVKTGKNKGKEIPVKKLIYTPFFSLKDEERRKGSQLFPIVPRSVDTSGKVRGAGNFILTVLVTEHDNYGERIKELSKKLQDKRESIIDQVSKTFD